MFVANFISIANDALPITFDEDWSVIAERDWGPAPVTDDDRNADAVTFLDALFEPGDPVFLASYPNNRGDRNFRPKNRVIRDRQRVARFLFEYDVPGRAIYFAVAVMKGSERGKDHVARINALHVDLDFKGIVEDRKAIEAALKALPCPPTITVFSGNGLHCYWRYDKALAPENAPSHEELMRRLCEHLAGDSSTAEVAHVMRLPGSRNSKNLDDIKPVEVLTDERLSSGRRYTYADIDEWLDQAEPVLHAKALPAKLNGKSDGTRKKPTNAYDEFGDDVRIPLNIEAKLEAMVFHGQNKTGIDDTTADIVGAMVRRKYTVEQCVEALLEPTRLVYERDAGKDDGPWSEKKARRIIISKFNYFTRKDAKKEREEAEAEEHLDHREGMEGSEPEPATKREMINSSEEFTRDFVPPDYLLDGVCLKAFMYALTAPTGSGKTALLMRLAMSVAEGREFAGREVTQGKVLYLAGENPDDVRMRWLAMAEHMEFDADTIEVYFIAGVYDIGKRMKRVVTQLAEKMGDVTLVIVDTGPAYFMGDSENDNVEMLQHAKILRSLVNLPGNPTVIAAMHPTKNAAKDSLLPRGGGAFLNEIDGNLVAWKEDMTVTLHWAGKHRGVNFDPMSFELESVTARKLIDSRGRSIPTVIMNELSDDEVVKRVKEKEEGMGNILLLLTDGRKHPTSAADIANDIGWMRTRADGKIVPDKRAGQTAIDKLKKDKLVDTSWDGAVITAKGRKYVEDNFPQRKFVE